MKMYSEMNEMMGAMILSPDDRCNVAKEMYLEYEKKNSNMIIACGAILAIIVVYLNTYHGTNVVFIAFNIMSLLFQIIALVMLVWLYGTSNVDSLVSKNENGEWIIKRISGQDLMELYFKAAVYKENIIGICSFLYVCGLVLFCIPLVCSMIGIGV